jgi:5'-3' exonuclease
MLFDNNIETLLSESKSFLLEGFNIFAIGKDDLPHIVCTAPNKSTARALHGLLEIAKKAHVLPGINGYVTGDAALVPQVLANGHMALTATLIINDDTVFKDGVEVEIEGEFIEAGTAGYDEFIDKLRKA